MLYKMLHCTLLDLLHVHVHCVYHVTCAYGTKRKEQEGNIEIENADEWVFIYKYKLALEKDSKNTQNIRAGSEITANYMKVHVLQLKHSCYTHVDG